MKRAISLFLATFLVIALIPAAFAATGSLSLNGKASATVSPLAVVEVTPTGIDANDNTNVKIHKWTNGVLGEEANFLNITSADADKYGGWDEARAGKLADNPTGYIREGLFSTNETNDDSIQLRLGSEFPTGEYRVVAYQESTRLDVMAVLIVEPASDFVIEGGVLIEYTGSGGAVTIPESVTEIGEGVFCFSGLTSVVIPDSVTRIGAGAFTCTDIESVTLPNKLESIGEYAFYETKLTSVVIPSSVKEIGENAFSLDITPDLVIYGENGTGAEKFAKDNGIPFSANTSSEPVDAPNLDTAATWAHVEINSAVAKGFVPADIQGDYKNIITRQEFCRMAVMYVEYKTGKTIDAVLTEQGKTLNSNAFSDTDDPNILAAYALGITSGTKAPTEANPGTFTPNGEFSREQAATMIMNTCKILGMDVSNLPAADFVDLNTASSWAANGINFVRANGIMSGTSTDASTPTFSPKGTYTRQESIVTFDRIK